MKCPFCGNPESKVVDSRPTDEGDSIRRRRECLVCRKRFTTYETIERVPIVVVKKDGSRQAFDRNKLIGSMLKSCEKRSVPLGTPTESQMALRSSRNVASESMLISRRKLSTSSDTRRKV